MTIKDRLIFVRIGLVATIVGGLALAAVMVTLLWLDGERDRILQDWQSRLTILAASRADAVGTWVKDQKAAISDLSSNDALRIYVTEIGGQPIGSDGTLSAERQYAETLLQVTARQNNFAKDPLGDDIPAGTARTPLAGMAIVDPAARLLASTTAVPERTVEISNLISAALAGDGVKSAPLYRSESGGALFFALAAPIRAIQGDEAVAAVIGIKAVDDELFSLLKQPGEVYDSAEAMLVSSNGTTVQYLSPLKGGSGALTKVLSLETPGLASAFALRSPRDFSIRNDYRGDEVLVTGWPVPDTDWMLVYKVSRAEALGETEARLFRTLLLTLAGIALAAVGALALWRHGVSVRAHVASQKYQKVAEELDQQVRFTRTLSDAEPNVTFVVDEEGNIVFANQKAAEETGSDSAESLLGKSMDAVFGPHLANQHRTCLDSVRTEGKPIVTTLLERNDGPDGVENPQGSRTQRSSYIPLDTKANVLGKLVLVVLEDLTAFLQAERRSHDIQADLVETLVSLIDNRDPSTADHSRRTANIAQKVAAAVGLGEAWVTAVEDAARLLNVGRIFVPAELFSRGGELSADEIEEVRKDILQGADFLSRVRFERPVGSVVRIALSLRGSDIPEPGGDGDPTTLKCARIVAAADALVAMTSARPYRDILDPDAALKTIGQREDVYGADVLAALNHVVRNLGGREILAGDNR